MVVIMILELIVIEVIIHHYHNYLLGIILFHANSHFSIDFILHLIDYLLPSASASHSPSASPTLFPLSIPSTYESPLSWMHKTLLFIVIYHLINPI
jgi:hypothetical protein